MGTLLCAWCEGPGEMGMGGTVLGTGLPQTDVLRQGTWRGARSAWARLGGAGVQLAVSGCKSPGPSSLMLPLGCWHRGTGEGCQFPWTRASLLRMPQCSPRLGPA